MEKTGPTGLVILDGWGVSESAASNAIAQANPPFFNYLWDTYPHALLSASGKSVGLPVGFAGNSEVGHITIGAGRVVKQPLSHYLETIRDGTFFTNKALISRFLELKAHNRTLHLMGLISDAGVHSHTAILHALLILAAQLKLPHIFIHAILDGRDAPPQSAEQYLSKISDWIAELSSKTNIQIASIQGRFYALDRDNNWERTEESYNVLTQSNLSLKSHNPHHNTRPARVPWRDILEGYYTSHIFDEFIPPTRLINNGFIQRGDGAVFFNIRADRARQLTHLIAENAELAWLITAVPHPESQGDGFSIPLEKQNNSRLASDRLSNNTELDISSHCIIESLYNPPLVSETLLDVLQQAGKSIFTIAETEKYAHVTYFISGGREAIRPNETRVLIKSIPTKSYAQYPAMSAPEITRQVVESIQENPRDFYVINYANADMVGHSGNLEATKQAIACLDQQLSVLYKAIVEEQKGTLFITADHGNAEQKWDSIAQQPHTSHTTNPVPFIMVRKDTSKLPEIVLLKTLADIAPFILQSMGITPPEIMTGSR